MKVFYLQAVFFFWATMVVDLLVGKGLDWVSFLILSFLLLIYAGVVILCVGVVVWLLLFVVCELLEPSHSRRPRDDVRRIRNATIAQMRYTSDTVLNYIEQQTRRR